MSDVDFALLGRRFSQALHDIYAEADRPADLYAEAMRRALGYRPANADDGGRQLPYPTITASGLTTQAEADHLREGHTIIDRLNRESAEKQRDEARQETRRVRAEAWADAARYLRDWCNDRRIPARFRGEGFLLAADLIDPAVRKDQFGHSVKTTDTAA